MKYRIINKNDTYYFQYKILNDWTNVNEGSSNLTEILDSIAEYIQNERERDIVVYNMEINVEARNSNKQNNKELRNESI